MVITLLRLSVSVGEWLSRKAALDISGWFWSPFFGFRHLATAAEILGVWSGRGLKAGVWTSQVAPCLISLLLCKSRGFSSALFTRTSLTSSWNRGLRIVGLLTQWWRPLSQAFQWMRQRDAHLFWTSFGFTIMASNWLWVTCHSNSRAGNVEPPFFGWSAKITF